MFGAPEHEPIEGSLLTDLYLSLVACALSLMDSRHVTSQALSVFKRCLTDGAHVLIVAVEGLFFSWLAFVRFIVPIRRVVHNFLHLGYGPLTSHNLLSGGLSINREALFYLPLENLFLCFWVEWRADALMRYFFATNLAHVTRFINWILFFRLFFILLIFDFCYIFNWHPAFSLLITIDDRFFEFQFLGFELHIFQKDFEASLTIELIYGMKIFGI